MEYGFGERISFSQLLIEKSGAPFWEDEEKGERERERERERGETDD